MTLVELLGLLEGPLGGCRARRIVWCHVDEANTGLSDVIILHHLHLIDDDDYAAAAAAAADDDDECSSL